MLKKNKNKKIPIILVFLVQTVFAQTLYELDVNYGFGVSELSFNSAPGIALSIYPIKNFGFSAGIQYSSRWQTKTSKYIKDTNPAVLDRSDNYGDSLIFGYSIDKWQEELSGNILQIPLLLKFSNDSYYASAGVKIGAVQKASVSVDYSGLATEGCISTLDPDCLAPPLTVPPSQGFGKQNDSAFKTKINSKNSIMLAMEGGIKAKLNDNFSMLIGIFADYSFNKGFDRDLKPIIERIENKNGASIAANDRWKSWKPWSVGIAAKLSFVLGHSKNNVQEEICAIEPTPLVQKTTVKPIENTAPPSPTPVLPMQMPIRFTQQKNDSIIPDLPKFLLNRKVDFMFYYPEDQNQASETDSIHTALTQQIANTLKEKPDAQLNCVGYSEKLFSPSVAYETAFQRAIDIRSNLVRFYGIEEKRISTYSQGSKNTGYRRTECFLVDNP